MVLCKNCLWSEPENEEDGEFACFYYQAYVIDDLSDGPCEGYNNVHMDSDNSEN